MKSASLTLFATQIFREALLDPERDVALLEDALTAAWAMSEDDDAGNDWCAENGYPGYTSYASPVDLRRVAPAFGDIAARLDAAAAKLPEMLFWDTGKSKPVLDSFWVNVLEPGGTHSGHIHPNCVLSGTLWLALPDGSAPIRFEDPRLPMMMAAPRVKADAPNEARRFVSITPQAGEALFWESWLRHEVPLHGGEDARISLSFNFSLS